jgi:hypothetical protein
MNWEFLVQCERGHLIKVHGVLLNADGRGEVLPPIRCERCNPPPRPLSRRKQRKIMQQFHQSLEEFRWPT